MYVVPQKEIKNVFEVTKYYRSEAYKSYMGMLRRLNQAVKGKETYAPDVLVNTRVRTVMDMIAEIERWVEHIPLQDMHDQRFGNKAFRDWYAKLEAESSRLVGDLLPDDKKDATVELCPYLLDSFGNQTRIDYGSGHEANFLMFIYCLFHLNVLHEGEDDVAVALRLFQAYLRCARRLQRTYHMEPAGSRGVHALDDFQFVPFIWGSAQLIGNSKRLTPDHYLNSQTVEVHSCDNLFFEAVHFINETKFGPFYEHSNQLYNISAVPSWEKMNSGMFKMYEGEVLKKFPIIQHFLFGSMLSINQREEFTKAPNPGAETADTVSQDSVEADETVETEAHWKNNLETVYE